MARCLDAGIIMSLKMKCSPFKMSLILAGIILLFWINLALGLASNTTLWPRLCVSATLTLVILGFVAGMFNSLQNIRNLCIESFIDGTEQISATDDTEVAVDSV